jgi:acetyl esterase/lipase
MANLLQFALKYLLPLLSLTAAGGMLFLTLWLVVPAPAISFLALAIGAAELSPRWLVYSVLATLLAIAGIRQSWLCGVALGMSLLSLTLCLALLVRIPATHAHMSTAMEQGLGKDYLAQIPAAVKARWRSQPFSWWDIRRGITIPEVKITKDILFASPAGAELRLNLYQAATENSLSTKKHPTLVTIHGGSWQTGSADSDETLSRYFAAQGYTVVSITYRKAPQYPFPAQIEDVQTALAAIRRNAEAWKIDIDRVALIGRSAGAHLALLAAYQPSPVPIQAVISYYGPIDLTEGYWDLPKPDPINVRSILVSLIGGTPEQKPALYRQASPSSYIAPALPTTLLVYAGRDHIVLPKFGRRLYEQLQAANNRVVYLEIPWAEHAFDALFFGVSNQLALYHTERFLASALQPKANS